jgi:hypothetical protein
MENSQKLLRFSLKDTAPSEALVEYFDNLYWNSSLYMCLVNNKDNSPGLYLEKTKNYEKIIRVFTGVEEASIYAEIVAEKESLPLESVKKWEIKFYDLIEYLNKVSKKYKENNKTVIKVVASGVYEEKLVELDVLWTDIEKFIN